MFRRIKGLYSSREGNPHTGVDTPLGLPGKALRISIQSAKGATLSALSSFRPYPQDSTPGTHFCLRLSRF